MTKVSNQIPQHLRMQKSLFQTSLSLWSNLSITNDHKCSQVNFYSLCQSNWDFDNFFTFTYHSFTDWTLTATWHIDWVTNQHSNDLTKTNSSSLLLKREMLTSDIQSCLLNLLPKLQIQSKFWNCVSISVRCQQTFKEVFLTING